MMRITFRYRDNYSNWEWRVQRCTVPSIEECIRIYGLDNCEHEILEIENIK